jgi:hypothetical protein
LTDDDVLEIRRLHGSATTGELSKKFGVCRTHIQRIVKREKWASV